MPADTQAITPEERASSRRARKLLRLLLTQKDYMQVMRLGYLQVRSPNRSNRVYRVPRDGGMVWVYEDDKPIAWLCLQSVEQLPADDVLVLHKLMIEGSEVEYLARANHFMLDAPNDVILRGLAHYVAAPWNVPTGQERGTRKRE